MDDPAAIVGAGPVLCLAPHPDDESLACGALLAACWQDGIPAHVVCLTDGAASHPGSRSWPPTRLAALRRMELEEAIEILGGDLDHDLSYLGHPDAGLHKVNPDGVAGQIGTLIDRTAARVLLAPSIHDPHCDHVAAAGVAMLLWQSRPEVRLISYPVWSRWAAGNGWVPQEPGTRRHLFDITELRDAKAAAIAAHGSQIGEIITDDPDGFVMPEGFAATFVAGPEIFDEWLR